MARYTGAVEVEPIPYFDTKCFQPGTADLGIETPPLTPLISQASLSDTSTFDPIERALEHTTVDFEQGAAVM
jgi:hypothetical protein